MLENYQGKLSLDIQLLVNNATRKLNSTQIVRVINTFK